MPGIFHIRGYTERDYGISRWYSASLNFHYQRYFWEYPILSNQIQIFVIGCKKFKMENPLLALEVILCIKYFTFKRILHISIIFGICCNNVWSTKQIIQSLIFKLIFAKCEGLLCWASKKAVSPFSLSPLLIWSAKPASFKLKQWSVSRKVMVNWFICQREMWVKKKFHWKMFSEN